MADRERKRAELRKRKRRSERAGPRVRASEDDQAARRAAIAARTEAKNEAAREQLEPLAPGQRPTVVTVAAVISALIALSAIVGYLAGVKVTRIGSDGIEQGEHRRADPLGPRRRRPDGDDGVGMWRARYWAVLGFQALLVIVLVAASLGLVQATSWLQAAGTTLLIVGAAALFYFMIKAMARIQMPERRAPD